MANNEPPDSRAAREGDSSDGDADEEVFRDPDTNNNLTKILTEVLTKGVVDAIQRAVESTIADAGPPPGDQASAQASGFGHADHDGTAEDQTDFAPLDRAGQERWLRQRQQEQQTAAQGGIASRLVRSLAGAVGAVLLNPSARSELTRIVATILNEVQKYGLTHAQAVAKIGQGMLERKCSWTQLLCFLAFCALLVNWRAAKDVASIVKEVVKAARDFIVGILRAAFLKLGGWFGFLKVYDSTTPREEEDVRRQNEEVDRHMKAIAFVVCIVFFAGCTYSLWKDWGPSPPSAHK